jgi:hypothetical protein
LHDALKQDKACGALILFFLLITDPALLQPCDRVAKQLFAYKLAPLHPVLKGELLRTASQLGRLADEGRAHHRCRSRKNILFV